MGDSAKKPAVYTRYFLSIGNADRPQTVQIRPEIFPKSLEVISQPLLNHIYYQTFHWNTNQAVMRSENMYVGDVVSGDEYRKNNPGKFDAIYYEALENALGQKHLITDTVCLGKNGGHRLLKSGEKVFDNKWSCVWPHDMRGIKITDFSEEESFAESVYTVNAKLFGVPERLYYFYYPNGDENPEVLMRMHGNYADLINHDKDYRNVSSIRMLEGTFDIEEKMMRLETDEVFAVFGENVRHISEYKKDDFDTYVMMENIWKESGFDGNPDATRYIIKRYGENSVSFLAKNTTVLDNNMNVIFPPDAVARDKAFKQRYFKAMVKSNFAEIKEHTQSYIDNAVSRYGGLPGYILAF